MDEIWNTKETVSEISQSVLEMEFIAPHPPLHWALMLALWSKSIVYYQLSLINIFKKYFILGLIFQNQSTKLNSIESYSLLNFNFLHLR